eukprot:scaffold3543_cov121-Cylindrotheca_fusiformis.AAC.2
MENILLPIDIRLVQTNVVPNLPIVDGEIVDIVWALLTLDRQYEMEYCNREDENNCRRNKFVVVLIGRIPPNDVASLCGIRDNTTVAMVASQMFVVAVAAVDV